jgi:diacylglycerol kinase family enzyme
MRWRAIANQDAGRPRRAERIAAGLLARGEVDDFVVARAPGDTTRACHDRTFDGFVVVGGDGTIAAAIAGMDRQSQALAAMPCGHGNCLARALSVQTLPLAISALAARVIEPIDLMRVRVRRVDGSTRDVLAASTLAIGYVADVVQFGRKHLSSLGGYAYPVASVMQTPGTVRLRLSIGEDAPLEERLSGVVVNNTPHLANFRAFPSARLDDGRLDVMLMSAGWARQVLHNLAVVIGSAAFGPMRLTQATTIGVEVDDPCTLMADGELIADVVAVDVQCERRALRVVKGGGTAAG